MYPFHSAVEGDKSIAELCSVDMVCLYWGLAFCQHHAPHGTILWDKVPPTHTPYCKTNGSGYWNMKHFDVKLHQTNANNQKEKINKLLFRTENTFYLTMTNLMDFIHLFEVGVTVGCGKMWHDSLGIKLSGPRHCTTFTPLVQVNGFNFLAPDALITMESSIYVKGLPLDVSRRITEHINYCCICQGLKPQGAF